MSVDSLSNGYDSDLNNFEFKKVGNGYALQKYTGDFETVRVPSIVNNLEVIEINSKAFDRKRIKSIVLPATLNRIGSHAFNYCEALQSITLPDRLEFLESGAFYNCTNLTNINLSKQLIEIGEYAFYNCNSLTNIEFPNSIREVGEYAFSGCSNLVSIQLPVHLKEINRATFKDCTNLVSIKFPSELHAIGDYAFANCKKVKNIDFPSGLTKFGRYAFSGCINLLRVNLPSNLVYIAEHAFSATLLYKLTDFDGGFELWYLDDPINLSSEIELRHYFQYYDDSIFRQNDPINKIKAIIVRLSSPYLLHTNSKKSFVDYLKRFWNKLDDYAFLVRLSKKWFKVFTDNEVITKSNIDKFITYAKDNNDLEAVAYLMNYKDEHFGKSSKTYRL